MPDLTPHRTIRQGATHRWWARTPGPVTATPELVFHLPTGDHAPGLTQALPPVTITAQPTRDTLTASGTLSAPAGLQHAYGLAWLVVPGSGAVSVKVAEVDGTTIRLAERLPFNLDFTEGNGTLSGALWYCDLTAANVTAAATRTEALGDRPVPWTMTYTVQAGADLPTEPGREAGTVNVARQPFDTGLTHDGLVTAYPELVGNTPPGFSSLAPYIERALRRLAKRVRQALQAKTLPGGAHPDDIDGGPLYDAHAALAASFAVGRDEPERAAALLAEFEAEFELGMDSVWLDADRDGVVDAGESPVQVVGPFGSEIGGDFTVTPASTRAFTFGVGDDL
ncbi:MAG: hypothetical protein KC613_23725 [Myxococcales bacterium]|nr:hypothetical protein [Myxococcales bacterium]